MNITRLFTGRLTQRQYIQGYAMILALYIISGLVLVASLELLGVDSFGTYIMGAVFALVQFISLGITVRRLHDLRASGWISILAFIVPLGNLILPVFLMFLKGRADENDYGTRETLTYLDILVGSHTEKELQGGEKILVWTCVLVTLVFAVLFPSAFVNTIETFGTQFDMMRQLGGISELR